MHPMYDDPDRHLNRELSLLDFQERVLALAEDRDRPLLERVRFVAIVSANLDEFFQVRVAGLQEQVLSGVTRPGPDGRAPRDQLAEIRPRVEALNDRMDALFLKDLAPRLAEAGIAITSVDALEPHERRELDASFAEQVFPILTPLAVDPSHPFPYISNLSLNLAVLLHRPEGGRRFARIKLPPNVPRFLPLPDGTRFVPIEQVVGANLDRLFGGIEIDSHHVFRVTRTADLAVEEDEADDLLTAMEEVLRYRRFSARAVRLEVDTGIPDHVLELLLDGLELGPDDVYRREAPLGLNALAELADLDRPELKDPPQPPITPPRFVPSDGAVDFFSVIADGDVLVHHPYESFGMSTGAFLAQAAGDPDVVAIKQTLYRTSMPEDPALGGEESIVRSLMAATEAGKQVVVLVELKARFDEAANINWARMLEAAGVHVVYGVHGLKTHAKLLLVVRRENGRLRRYAHIGTGNYNPKTARIYEDVGLFTADDDLGADLTDLFNHLTGYAMPPDYRRLLVAPHFLRDRIVARIREQAALGPDGRIVWKLNHLVDPAIIDELYRAAQAGCRIRLVVRGICCLRPGVPGLSEGIRVRSLVGRYLEHSRIYRFGPPGTEGVYYVGSSDMMPRNLNGRVECLVPVADPRLKARLQEILDVEWADDTLAWELGPDGWSKVPTLEGIDAHETLYRLASHRAEGDRG
ncbi:MAG TPA: polyphosphate kinase 1 [Actinobacteria bacterium]|nr:polyphosphate kinase 1 [Actinomycetota bacterium]